MGFFSNLWNTVTKNPLKIILDPIGTVTRGAVTATTGLSDVEQFAIALPIAAGVVGGPVAGQAASIGASLVVPSVGGMRPPVLQPTAGGTMPFSLTSPGGGGFLGGFGEVARDLALSAGSAFIQSRIGGGGAVGPAPVQMAGLRMPGGLGPAMAVGGGLAAGRTVLAAIKARVAGVLGKNLSIRRIVAIIKRLGPTVAATALGLSAVEIAQLLAASPSRRARGISASNIRTTKRTIKKIVGVACQVQQVGTIKVSGIKRGCK